MSSERILRVNELLRLELNKILLTEVERPSGCVITITAVETTKDLNYAKVWISIFPFYLAKNIVKTLKRKATYFQSLLYKKLSLKPLPKIQFYLDTAPIHSNEVEQILDRIKDEF